MLPPTQSHACSGGTHFTQPLHSLGRRAGARRAQHPDHILVGHDCLGGGLAADIGAQIIEAGAQINAEALDWAVVVHRDVGGPVDGQTKPGHIAGDRLQRPDLNRISRLDFDNAERPVTQGIALVAKPVVIAAATRR